MDESRRRASNPVETNKVVARPVGRSARGRAALCVLPTTLPWSRARSSGWVDSTGGREAPGQTRSSHVLLPLPRSPSPVSTPPKEGPPPPRTTAAENATTTFDRPAAPPLHCSLERGRRRRRRDKGPSESNERPASAAHSYAHTRTTQTTRNERGKEGGEKRRPTSVDEALVVLLVRLGRVGRLLELDGRDALRVALGVVRERGRLERSDGRGEEFL